MKQIHEAVQALESQWHRILVAILDFVEEVEKWQKNYWANSLGPICILQIFINNPSSGVKLMHTGNIYK